MALHSEGRKKFMRRKVRSASSNGDMVSSHSDGGWQFINISHVDQGSNVELRRKVRANAMRYYNKSLKEQGGQPKREHRRENCKGANCSKTRKNLPEALKGLVAEPQGDRQSLCVLVVRKKQDVRSETGHGVNLHRQSNVASGHPTSPTSPYALLGSGNSDPFDTLPVNDSAQDSQILHHCKSPKA